MCGISGFNFNDEALIKRMNEVTRHRGPDATGIFLANKISLGNNRLSIIDLDSQSNQPMEDTTGRYVIVYNGEIYNYRELKKELKDFYRFRTESDTEVILASFIKWGTLCVEKLNGIFAFAIWDKEKEELFLARDHAGIKPLYYYLNKGKFIFASEIKSILEHPVPRILNKEAFGLYFQLFYVPAPLTMFQDILKFPLGSIGLLKNGNLTLSSYKYSASFPRENIKTKSQSVQATKDVITQSVCSQMVSDRPVGIFLSGGLDSNIILASLKASGYKDIDTFSIGFELDSEQAEEKFNTDFDLAKRSSEFFGTHHHEVILKYEEVPQLFEDVVWHLDEPVAVPTALSVLKLSRYAASKVKVILTGNGGDELFLGYERYRLSLLADLYQKYLPIILRDRFSNFNKQFKKLNTPRGLERYALFMFQNQGSNDLKWIKNRELLASPKEFFRPLFVSLGNANSEYDESLPRADRLTWLPNQSLVISDKMSMAASLEIRVPMLDRNVCSLADNIPYQWKIDVSSKQKKMLREAFRDMLPPFLLTQDKRGWFSPGSKWLRQESMRTFWKDLLNQNYYEETAGLFDFNELNTLFDEHYEKGIYSANLLWPVLTFQLWARKFKVKVQ